MRRLIIAPHVDDDVLGCGGILDETCTVFYCGVDDFHRINAPDRRLEAERVARRADSQFWWPIRASERPADHLMLNSEQWATGGIHYYACNRNVNSYMITGLIADFELLIKAEQPDEIYIPAENSYNQDHQVVHDAAMVALRPHDEIPLVGRVLAYEQPHVLFWPRGGRAAQPTFFRAIDVEEKVARYQLMASQVREFRSPEHIRALARLRGGSIGVQAAEAFHVMRWVG